MQIRLAAATEQEMLLEVWLRSVNATHTFVARDDIQAMLPQVREYLASTATQFWVMSDVDGTLAGFMGLGNNEMESLFLAPEFQRRGLGRQMVAHALALQPDLTVEVNEANRAARDFYESCGFVVSERMEWDRQGRPYPLLKMTLPRNATSD